MVAWHPSAHKNVIMEINNKYYLLRHGEAISNIKQITSSWPETFENPLTANGKRQIKEAAKKLKGKHIEYIFASDLLRTKMTAGIVAKALKLEVKFDTRLREVGFGDLNGRPAEELLYLGFEKERLGHSMRGAESYQGVLERVRDFIEEINETYQGSTILIVSHQCPLWILENDIDGFSLSEGLERNPEEVRIGRGEIRELN